MEVRNVKIRIHIIQTSCAKNVDLVQRLYVSSTP
jgi:hypothetical protein